MHYCRQSIKIVMSCTTAGNRYHFFCDCCKLNSTDPCHALLQVDLALLDVIGPYPASIHDYDVSTQTWHAEHASVSIERSPFHGNSLSKYRCYKIYHAGADGRIHLCVGKEGITSQISWQSELLQQKCVMECVEKLNSCLGLQDSEKLEVMKTSVLNVPVLQRCFLFMPFVLGAHKPIPDVSDTSLRGIRLSKGDLIGAAAAEAVMETESLLQSLSHFSLAASDSQLIVLDPCLIEGRLFTGMRLHELVSKVKMKSFRRILRFVDAHRCNKYCQILHLAAVDELMKPWQEAFGTPTKGTIASTRGEGPWCLRSPRGGVGGGEDIHHNLNFPNTKGFALAWDPGNSGNVGGDLYRAVPCSTLRPMTAGILDHPQPDLQELLAKQPWSYFSARPEKSGEVGNASPVKSFKSGNLSPDPVKSVKSSKHEKTMSALSAGNVHSTSKKHAQQQSALFPTQTLEESLPTETAGVKDIPSPMSRQAGQEDTSIMSNALNEMSLDSQITLSNSVKTDEVPNGVQSMLSSVSLDRKSICPLSPRALEKREKAQAQRALEKARMTAYLTEPPTPATRPKSTTPSRTSSLLLPVSLSSNHREPPRVRLPYYLRQNNARHQKTPLSKDRADGSEGSHPHLSYSTHPDGLDCLDVDYKDGLLEGVYLKDSDIRIPKGEKLISKSSGKGLLSLASWDTAAAPMQTFKAPVDKSQRLVFFSKYRNLFATPIPVKQSLPVPLVPPPGDFWEKKIVSLEPPDSKMEIFVDR